MDDGGGPSQELDKEMDPYRPGHRPGQGRPGQGCPGPDQGCPCPDFHLLVLTHSLAAGVQHTLGYHAVPWEPILHGKCGGNGEYKILSVLLTSRPLAGLILV